MPRIESLDHLVLTVASLDATCAFYFRVLGVEVRVSAQGRRSLHFGQQKINLHERGHEIDPKAAHPTPGAGDLCFVTRDTVESVLAELGAADVPVETGPVAREGARGPMTSVYFRDPDQNLIEVAVYPGTHPPQPPGEGTPNP